MALVCGRSSPAIYCKRKTSEDLLEIAMPRTLPGFSEKIWRHCATRDIDALATHLQKKKMDVGLLLDLFVTKSLLYNSVALNNMAAELSMAFGPFVVMCCYRRRAYETLIDLCVRWASCTTVHPTNNRAVRLVIAVAMNDYDEVKGLLRAHCDPSAMHNLSLIVAVTRGFYRIVELLLADRRVDASDNNSAILVYAAGQGNGRVFELVLRNPEIRVDEAGPSAVIASINEGHSGYALEILNHPDWPQEACDEVVDTILVLDKTSVDFLPLLHEARDMMKRRARETEEATQEIKNIRKRLNRLGRRIDQTTQEMLVEIENELREAEKKAPRQAVRPVPVFRVGRH